MSDMQSLGQQVAKIHSDSNKSAAAIYNLANELQKTIDTVCMLLQSSAQHNYHNIVNQFSSARTSLQTAAECLASASRSANNWLEQHVNSALNSEPAPSVAGLESQQGNTHEQLALPDLNSSSQNYSKMVDSLDRGAVGYRELYSFGRDRSTDEIVNRLGGGDNTDGSCSSLAFAYIGNIAGYDVLDFRDGESRRFFSRNSSIEMIANLPEVDSIILSGKDDVLCTNHLLSTMIPGKEYYLATGLHAAIVRKVDDHYEYLELQHPTNNGWHGLDDFELMRRFGCSQSNLFECPNFLIDVASLADNQEFLAILGYLNTAESEQRKGDDGYVR